LLGLVEDRGWDTTNGNMKADKREELRYVGEREESMMNYVLVNQKAWDKTEKMEIGNKVESNHQSLEVEIGIEKEREIERYKIEVKEIIEWGGGALGYIGREKRE